MSDTTITIPDELLIEFRKVVGGLLNEHSRYDSTYKLDERVLELLKEWEERAKQHCVNNFVCMSKGVCKKCRNKNKTKNLKWKDSDERNWDVNEVVDCIGYFSFNSDGQPIMYPRHNRSKYDPPPEHCEYKLEHLVATQRHTEKEDNV